MEQQIQEERNLHTKQIEVTAFPSHFWALNFICRLWIHRVPYRYIGVLVLTYPVLYRYTVSGTFMIVIFFIYKILHSHAVVHSNTVPVPALRYWLPVYDTIPYSKE
jgi:hypothetical protein